jgi:7-keto-8-aminopelargonate synthetase-like enzyme
MTRNDEITLEMTRICRSEGLLVIPVCYPAVPIDAPRLRTCVSAIHTREDIDFALDVLAGAGRQTGLIA